MYSKSGQVGPDGSRERAVFVGSCAQSARLEIVSLPTAHLRRRVGRRCGLSLPGCVVVVFNDGPLAWNGVFAFYIPGLVLVIWLFSTTAVMLKSIKAEQAALAAA